MRIRLRFKVLGLSMLALGVMAIGTTGAARAETGACWGYINAAINLQCFGELSLEAGIKFQFTGNTGTLLIENVNFEVLCTAGSFINGGKLTSNGSITLGQIMLTGCIGLSKTPTLTKLTACTPKDPVGGKGTIISEKVTGLIVLHELISNKVKDPVVEIKPDTGELIFPIFLGEECSVSEEICVKGKLILSDVGGKTGFEEHKLTHTFQEFSALQLMKVGVNKATIDGSAVFSLTSPHDVFKWAGKAA